VALLNGFNEAIELPSNRGDEGGQIGVQSFIFQ
jgi:hypothetical protein